MAHHYEHTLVDSWKPESLGDTVEGEIFTISSKVINGEPVPYVELTDFDGVPVSILMSTFALESVWRNPLLQEGGYLAIVYDGESKTIKKANNFAKRFKVCYYEPNKWHYAEDGGFVGEPTTLKPPTNTREAENLRTLETGSKEAPAEDSKPAETWPGRNVEQDASPDPFDPEDELQSASARIGKGHKKNGRNN